MKVQTHLKKAARTSSGFTLVELMVVIAIIGLLAAVVTVNVMGQTYKARKGRCQADFKQAQRFRREVLQPFTYSTSVSPTFLGETDRFWYRFQDSNGVRYMLVDPVQRTRHPLFDHEDLAARVSAATRAPVDGTLLNLERLKVADDGDSMTFNAV